MPRKARRAALIAAVVGTIIWWDSCDNGGACASGRVKPISGPIEGHQSVATARRLWGTQWGTVGLQLGHSWGADAHMVMERGR